MALDNIKRLRAQAARRALEKSEEKQKAAYAAEEKSREWREQRRPVVACLKQIEGYFWECANDFSKLTRLRIKGRNRALLYPLVSTPTMDEPVLRVYFQSPNDGYRYNSVTLTGEARTSRSLFEFNAHCTSIGKNSFSANTYYGEIREYFEIKSQDSFDVQDAQKWLEREFERYCSRMGSLKSHK